MSNRVKIRRPKRKSHKQPKSGAVNLRKRAEKAEAERLGYPSRKKYLKAIKRANKGIAKPIPQGAVAPFLESRHDAEAKSVTLYKPETLERANLADLRKIAADLGLKGVSKTRKAPLIREILYKQDEIKAGVA
jgi:hypothetical protein